MAILSNINLYFDCKIRLCLIVPCRQQKTYFTQESFYLQGVGILDDINEQDTSFLDYNHKHMMKSGAPPDKFRVLDHMVTSRINSNRNHSLVPGLTSIFLEAVWVPLIIFVYAFNRNKNAKLYHPSMFQTSDIELQSQKI